MLDAGARAEDGNTNEAFAERRGAERHLSVFRVGRLAHSGGDALCRVRNISSRGAKVECGDRLAFGTAVTLEVRTDKAMAATVRWCRDGAMGLQFDAPIDIQDILREERQQIARHRSRAPRFNRTAGVRLITDGKAVAGTLVNVSMVGLCVATTDLAATKGLGVVACVDGLAAGGGEVRWSYPGLIGIQLSRPFDYEALRCWLEKSRDPP